MNPFWSGWEAHLQKLIASGRWLEVELTLPVNMLCVRAVLYRFLSFSGTSWKHCSSDVRHYYTGGILKTSRGACVPDAVLSRMQIILWAELHTEGLVARYFPGRKNVVADQVSHKKQVLLMEWFLHLSVFNGIC